MIVFVFPIFLRNFSSPSRSVITISGLIRFSINFCVALSATIFGAFLNFFKVGIHEWREGPAPITKTVFPEIIFFNFYNVTCFFRIVFSNHADSKSCFCSYPHSFRISKYFVSHPEIVI